MVRCVVGCRAGKAEVEMERGGGGEAGGCNGCCLENEKARSDLGLARDLYFQSLDSCSSLSYGRLKDIPE